MEKMKELADTNLLKAQEQQKEKRISVQLHGSATTSHQC